MKKCNAAVPAALCTAGLRPACSLEGCVTQCRRARLRSTVFLIFLLLPSILAAGSPVSISILSILKPAELIITLREPDRAVLRANLSETVIAAHALIRVELRNDRLWIDSGIATPSAEIECAEFCVLELQLPGRIPRQYRGNLKLTTRSSTINIVLSTDEEDLLASIVASEMGEYRLRPALQAFAVVARSFLRLRSRHPELGADFCDLTHCQVFQAYAPTPEARNAVRDTAGLVLTYRQRPFRAYYFRSCGGSTATFEEVWKQKSPDYPFTSVKCTCITPWETELQASQLELLLGFPVTRIHQNETDLVFTGSNGETSYSLEDFRILAGRALGWNKIRSNAFVVKQNGPLLIQGKGAGHRVGFCQNGAFQMAQRGKSFQQILQHYFPNTEIRAAN